MVRITLDVLNHKLNMSLNSIHLKIITSLMKPLNIPLTTSHISMSYMKTLMKRIMIEDMMVKYGKRLIDHQGLHHQEH